MTKKNVLVVVEGEKKDVKIAKTMFSVYGLDLDYNIVSYKTNIYVLYHMLFVANNPEDIDLIQLLKQEEQDVQLKKIFDQKYTDIILLFDFEPQDSEFDDEKIKALQNYFVESTDMGKLYIHYPMIEAFYHVASPIDTNFLKRKCRLSDLTKHKYKQIVAHDTDNKIYNQLIKDYCTFKNIVTLNIQKIYWFITGNEKNIEYILENTFQFNSKDILNRQLCLLSEDSSVFVFSTICLFVYDYQPKLLI